jgi:hypothetical protein
MMSRGILTKTNEGWLLTDENNQKYQLHKNSTEGWSMIERTWFFREMDNQEVEGEIINNTFKPHKPNMNWMYWKERCLAAEKYIDLTPCDPDVYEDQNMAYYNWISLVKNER